MYVRVLQIKFPNELAKNSVNALSRDMTKEFFKSGLLLRFNTDTSPNSLMITLLWEKKELFDIARKKYGDKFVAEVKEMGGIVTISDGLSEIDRAKEIDLSKFNEF
tara:strand:- start:17 stop:334 length:318 start_codon:yes stop_codon:yes gene_type:complete